MIMTGDAEELSQKIQKLISYAHSFEYSLDKNELDGVVSNIEFGLIKLNEYGKTAEVDFFQKKLDEIKEKVAKKKAGTIGSLKDKINSIKGLFGKTSE